MGLLRKQPKNMKAFEAYPRFNGMSCAFRHVACAAIATSLGACASQDDLLGAWLSDAPATMAANRPIEGTLSERQRQVFFNSGFFGQMAIVYRRHDAVAIYDGECHLPEPYEVVRRRFRMLELRSPGTARQDERHFIYVDGDTYTVPIAQVPGAVEVFRRTTIERLAETQPCVLRID